MLKGYKPGGPSDFAIKTAPERAARYARAERRGQRFFRTPLGDLDALLSPDQQELLVEFFESGKTGWFEADQATSTWVRRYGYWIQNRHGALAIQFHDGATCWYPTLGYEWYAAMANAPSSGKFIHEYIYKKVGYQLVSG